MKIDQTTDFLTGAKSWTITIWPREYEAAHFTHADQLLLDECAGPDATAADTLLGLELIARRIQESLAPA